MTFLASYKTWNETVKQNETKRNRTGTGSHAPSQTLILTAAAARSSFGATYRLFCVNGLKAHHNNMNQFSNRESQVYTTIHENFYSNKNKKKC